MLRDSSDGSDTGSATFEEWRKVRDVEASKMWSL